MASEPVPIHGILLKREGDQVVLCVQFEYRDYVEVERRPFDPPFDVLISDVVIEAARQEHLRRLPELQKREAQINADYARICMP